MDVPTLDGMLERVGAGVRRHRPRPQSGDVGIDLEVFEGVEVFAASRTADARCPGHTNEALEHPHLIGTRARS